jgi:hypothetical protein
MLRVDSARTLSIPARSMLVVPSGWLVAASARMIEPVIGIDSRGF